MFIESTCNNIAKVGCLSTSVYSKTYEPFWCSQQQNISSFRMFVALRIDYSRTWFYRRMLLLPWFQTIFYLHWGFKARAFNDEIASLEKEWSTTLKKDQACRRFFIFSYEVTTLKKEQRRIFNPHFWSITILITSALTNHLRC